MSVIAKIKSRRLLIYNIRILLGNSYWLIVTPIAAAEVVFFWSTATAGFSSAAGIARIVEMLGPILGAFLCAYAVAPEHAGVGELVFVRPVSPEKILLLRLAAIFAFVFALFFFLLLVPLFFLYRAGLKDLPLAPSLLAALISMLFLCALSLSIASATRQPLLGLAVAGGYWALDLLVGSGFNPLLTLHSFADFVAAKPMSELWWVNKLLLFGLAVVLYLWNRGLLGRPVAPRRALVVVRNTVLIALLVVGYMWSGAAYKVAYGLKHEAELGNQTQLWYQQQFSPYGPLPVAWLFGPAFPLYVQAQQGRSAATADSRGLVAPVDVVRMRRVVEEYPKSIWADNAQFEVARSYGRKPTPRGWVIYTYHEGGSGDDITVVDTDQMAVAREMVALVKQYPRSVFAPLALSHAASISLALLDFGAATRLYEQLLATYPSSPQATEAGLALNALYVREGRREDAFRAGDIAAAAANWDLRASAYLAAAEAAARLGKPSEAKERYQKARAAAKVMRRRAGGRIHGSGTAMTPAEIILTAERIMNTCDAALSGRAASAAPLADTSSPSAAVRVRIVGGEASVAGARVAIAEEANKGGRPSPFTSNFAAEATADRHGSAELGLLPARAYRVLGLALPGSAQVWDVSGVQLPIRVGDGQQTLPAFVLTPRKPTPRPPSGNVRDLTGAQPTRRGGNTRQGGLTRGRTTTREGGRGRNTRGGGGRPGGDRSNRNHTGPGRGESGQRHRTP